MSKTIANISIFVQAVVGQDIPSSWSTKTGRRSASAKWTVALPPSASTAFSLTRTSALSSNGRKSVTRTQMLSPRASSELNEQMLLIEIRQPMADEFNWADFVAIGFSHHIEIITKAKSLEARLFYIHESATRFWNKYVLRDYLKADLYNHRGTLPNNFTATMPSTKQTSRRNSGDAYVPLHFLFFTKVGNYLLKSKLSGPGIESSVIIYVIFFFFILALCY